VKKRKMGSRQFFDFFAVGSADGRPPGDLTQVLGTGLLVLDLCQYLNLGTSTSAGGYHSQSSDNELSLLAVRFIEYPDYYEKIDN